MVAVRRGSVAPAVVILVLTQLMFVVDTSIVNAALPDIGRELGFSSAGPSWVVTAYALTFDGLILLSGKVGSMIVLAAPSSSECRSLWSPPSASPHCSPAPSPSS